MVAMDVADVTEAAVETETPPAEPYKQPSRFDLIKASYKGVMSAIDVEDTDATYEDFEALLGEHKVGRPCPVSREKGRTYCLTNHFFKQSLESESSFVWPVEDACVRRLP